MNKDLELIKTTIENQVTIDFLKCKSLQKGGIIIQIPYEIKAIFEIAERFDSNKLKKDFIDIVGIEIEKNNRSAQKAKTLAAYKDYFLKEREAFYKRFGIDPINDFCTSEDFKTDLSKLCDNCPLTELIKFEIEEQIVFQASEQQEVLTESQFKDYLNKEIKNAQEGMGKAILEERNQSQYYEKNDPFRRNKIQLYIWNKERIKALNEFMRELEEPEEVINLPSDLFFIFPKLHSIGMKCNVVIKENGFDEKVFEQIYNLVKNEFSAKGLKHDVKQMKISFIEKIKGVLNKQDFVRVEVERINNRLINILRDIENYKDVQKQVYNAVNRGVDELNILGIFASKVSKEKGITFTKIFYSIGLVEYLCYIEGGDWKREIESKMLSIVKVNNNTELELKKAENKFYFKNNFNNLDEEKIFEHFHIGLVKSKLLTEPEFYSFLKAAFENKQVPIQKLSFKNIQSKDKVMKVFYEFYKNISGKPHGKQKEYAGLLGEYFAGFKTSTVSTNFSKSVY
jgi:hypothetical protein